MVKLEMLCLNFIFLFFLSIKNNEYMLLSRLYNIFGHMKIQMKKQQAKSIHVERAIDYIYENYSKKYQCYRYSRIFRNR